MQAQKHLAACRAILRTEHDPWRPFWNDADGRTRRALLLISGQSADLYASREWQGIGSEVRGEIKRRCRDMLGWLQSLPVMDEQGQGARV